MRLTTNMEAALKQAKKANGELRRLRPAKKGDRKHPWPNDISPQSVAACVRRGWLEEREGRDRDGRLIDRRVLTEEGRLALDPPPRLVRRGMYDVGDRQLQVVTGRDGVRRLVKVPVHAIRPEDLSPHHGLEAQRRWDEARDKRAKAHQLAARFRKRAA